ncbi:hypothetical protein F5884DRAFT_764634 [Xylogone sp. PMI_703]|nr:hypothetical protein F5884DRAFT_764634 [Xylogone sp. PMI_703]
MDRGRDRRLDSRGDGEVTKMGGGESYRPAARPRTPRDDYRDRDLSPRRDRGRSPRDRGRTPLGADSYYPGSRDRSRRRSRSPLYRGRDRTPPREISSWRSRPRSPMRPRSPRARTPPRRYSPRRDDDRRDRPRSPRRDDRRRSRSPYDHDRPFRARSPYPRRSPPPGPRGSWRPRSRTPDRRDDRRDDRIPSGPSSATWRRRSPSPLGRDSGRSSGRTSGSTSRRSSPPSKAAPPQSISRDDRPRPRSPPPREKSPAQHSIPYRDRDSARSTPKDRSPARPTAPRSPPRGPAGYRPTPTGPSSVRPKDSAVSPVISSVNSPVLAHSRPETSNLAVPPAGPRGYVPPTRGSPYPTGPRRSFGADRHQRPEPSSWGASRAMPDSTPRAPASISRPAPSLSPTTPVAPTGPTGIPTGPRAGNSITTRPPGSYSRPPQASSAPPGPRVHPAIANLSTIIPGGRIDPAASGIPGDLVARLKKRQEEEETIREELNMKQDKLRRGLKTWDRLSRDSSAMGLRSELSERHVRLLAGEGVGGKAF